MAKKHMVSVWIFFMHVILSFISTSALSPLGEDPVLTSALVTELVNHLQFGDDPKYNKIIATSKHWLGNLLTSRNACNSKCILWVLFRIPSGLVWK